jgi:hypothetical protein
MLSLTRKDLKYSPREAVDMAFSTLGWAMLSRADEYQFELIIPRIFIESLYLNHIFDGKYEALQSDMIFILDDDNNFTDCSLEQIMLDRQVWGCILSVPKRSLPLRL